MTHHDTEPQDVLVAFILDNTASMQSIKDATISGFNEYKNSLPKDADFSLTLFNSMKTDLYPIKKVKEVNDLDSRSYQPTGNTPLYDAIMQTIHHIDDMNVEKDKILCIIMTDGEENSSQQYTREQVFNEIRDHEDIQGWDFVYLGANQDSYQVGTSMGIKAGYTQNFAATSEGVRMASGQTMNSTSDYLSSTSSPENFFDPSSNEASTSHIKKERSNT